MTLHLLIIEDDAATADFLAEGLGQGGHRVEWAADGLTGLDRARSGEHDCIILDRLLPGMDGITLLQTLRNEGRAIAVIILSAIGSTDERVRGLRAGSDDYL
ncbi:MAG: response regulator, partial [Sphingobium sp.]